MSDRPPYPGWGAPGQPGQQQAAYPQYQMAPGGPPQQPHWQPRKRAKWPIVVAVVAVVAIGAGVGVWFLGPGGSGDDPGANLPENPDLTAMSFPDPDSFGYSDGPEAMCAALDEKMSARGYLHVSGKKSGGGQYCRFITPGLSLLTDGSNDLLVDIGVWRNDAEGRYAGLLESAVEKSQGQQKRPEYSVSKVERFPVGDSGFVFHREGDRTDTEAYFRSGEDLMLVSVWGTTVVSSTSEVPETKPLTEEITYREITDIVMSLSGDGEPGPPQITAPELAESPALAGLADLSLPEGMTVGDTCAKVATVAETLGMRRSAGDCGFESGSDDWRDYVEGYTERGMTIGVRDYPPEGNIVASEQMARDLRSLHGRAEREDYECSPLYGLPFADIGYAMYCDGDVQAGFVLDGRTYVYVKLHGFRKTGGELVHLPEDEVLGDLASVFTAMGK